MIQRNKFKVQEVQQFVKNVVSDGNKSELKLSIFSVQFIPETKCQDYGYYAKNCFKSSRGMKIRSSNLGVGCVGLRFLMHYKKYYRLPINFLIM